MGTCVDALIAETDLTFEWIDEPPLKTLRTPLGAPYAYVLRYADRELHGEMTVNNIVPIPTVDEIVAMYLSSVRLIAHVSRAALDSTHDLHQEHNTEIRTLLGDDFDRFYQAYLQDWQEWRARYRKG